jgi:hypothetical protein
MVLPGCLSIVWRRGVFLWSNLIVCLTIGRIGGIVEVEVLVSGNCRENGGDRCLRWLAPCDRLIDGGEVQQLGKDINNAVKK